MHEVTPATAQISDEMARLARRDRELTVLLNSARALVQIDDVDTLLQELVDRAYELMGSDLTYLSAYDDATGDLWVRASRGAVSENLRKLRVPAGFGLASKVVETQAAQWTMDYPHASLELDSTVSAAVDAEALKSLLGVPMLAEGRLLGALFAADRYTHDFSADEIALLTAFADHAAVVLHRARLFAAVETAAERAAAAQARAEQHASDMERAARVHEKLTTLVLGGEDAAAVCETLAAALNREVAAARPDATFLAGHRRGWWNADGQLRQALLDALEVSATTGRAVTVPGHSGFTVVSAAVAAGTPIVSLIVGGTESLRSLELRTVERASQLLALLLMQQEARARAEDSVRGELAADLVSGRGATAVLRRRAESQGLSLAERYLPVAVPLESMRRSTIRHQLGAVAPHLLATDNPDGLSVLVPAQRAADEIIALRRHIGMRSARSGLLVVGQVAEIQDLPAKVQQVWQLADLLPHLGIKSGEVTVAEFLPYLAVFGGQAETAQAFVDALIGKLIRWDANSGSELVKTLSAYLDSNASLRRTAEVLYVHVNTVKQRLARITDILGEGWRESEVSFRLRVALGLYRVQSAE